MPGRHDTLLMLRDILKIGILVYSKINGTKTLHQYNNKAEKDIHIWALIYHNGSHYSTILAAKDTEIMIDTSNNLINYDTMS